jgi:HEAT repeat protein
MKLPHWIVGAFLATSFVGCGGSKPDANPPKTAPAMPPETGSSAPETSAKQKSPATSEAAGSPSIPPKIKQGPAEPPPRVDDEIRSLAARLVEKSPDGAWRINEAAALEMEKLGDQAQLELVNLLGDAKTGARRGAAFYLLAKFNSQDAKQVAGYSKLLDDPEPFLRNLGFQAVRRMQKSDQSAAVPRLAKLLDARQEAIADNRAALARLLGSLKEDAAPALEALEAGAKDDESPKVRGAYLVAVSQIASPSDALPALRQGLADPDAAVRLVAAARLRQLSKDAPSAAAPAAADLAQALEDSDSRVREAAAEALAILGEPAVEPLGKYVDSKRPATRQLAIACLGKIGPAAKSALPLVEKHLADEDVEVQKVAQAVVKILTSP